jgi:hypothetical protein
MCDLCQLGLKTLDCTSRYSYQEVDEGHHIPLNIVDFEEGGFLKAILRLRPDDAYYVVQSRDSDYILVCKQTNRHDVYEAKRRDKLTVEVRELLGGWLE